MFPVEVEELPNMQTAKTKDGTFLFPFPSATTQFAIHLGDRFLSMLCSYCSVLDLFVLAFFFPFENIIDYLSCPVSLSVCRLSVCHSANKFALNLFCWSESEAIEL